MGKSYTPKYRLEFQDSTRKAFSWECQAWKGKTTQKALEAWIFGYADSLKIGGVNEHISKALGLIPYPTKARIIRQADDQIMAEWEAGMFQCF